MGIYGGVNSIPFLWVWSCDGLFPVVVEVGARPPTVFAVALK